MAPAETVEALPETLLDRRIGHGGFVVILLIASISAFLIAVSVFWVGFLGSDDTLYWAGAGGWLAHVPYLGTTHWALRHTLVIPMAIARRLLGDGFPALLLPTLCYSVGIVVLTAIWIERAAGKLAAAAAMALIVTNPQFVLLSSIAYIDVVEIFFVFFAFALMHNAMDRRVTLGRGGYWALLLLAGVSMGLAMLSRETSAFAIVAIGLLFLAGYGINRSDYFVIGTGCAFVVGLEFLFVWSMSGNLFYRFSISLHHDNSIDRWADQGAAIPIVHPLVDPVTMLLLNHNFGLLAWIGIPLAVWLARRGRLNSSGRHLLVLAVTLGVTWTVICAGMWTLLALVPRYFLLPALLLSMLSGVALARLWYDGRRRLAASLGAVLIVANLLSLLADNRNYMFGEFELADIAARQAGVIHTDRQTMRRAELLLDWKGASGRVTDAQPGSGDLFYLNPARSSVQPSTSWIVMERHGLPPTIGQSLASHLLPAGTLSPSMYGKLGRGHPDVTLYQVP